MLTGKIIHPTKIMLDTVKNTNSFTAIVLDCWRRARKYFDCLIFSISISPLKPKTQPGTFFACSNAFLEKYSIQIIPILTRNQNSSKYNFLCLLLLLNPELTVNPITNPKFKCVKRWPPLTHQILPMLTSRLLVLENASIRSMS